MPARGSLNPPVSCYLLRLDPGGSDSLDAAAFAPPEERDGLTIHRAAIDAARHGDAAAALLPQATRARLEAMREPGLRRARLVAHAMLRLLLAQRLDVPARDLVFEAGPYGKPALRDHPATQVSLSWREGMAGLAIAQGNAVGIDVETEAGAVTVATVAPWLFSPQEQAELAAAPTVHRRRRFLETWTRKEALCKAAGLPLDTMRGRDTREVEVALTDADGTPARFAASSHAEGEAVWSLAWQLASAQPG